MPDILQSAIGIIVIAALAWVIGALRSRDWRRVPWRVALAGVALQFAFAVLLLKVPGVSQVFAWLNRGVAALDRATMAGTAFVFGYLGGAPLPFAEGFPGASFILAFKALPLVLVVSALSALLWHWRVLPVIVAAFSRLLERTMGVGGAVGLSTAANVFVGMVEAPLLIRPYLRTMSLSGLFAVMVGGMASIAGTVMVLYATILNAAVPGAIGHILAASLISAPAAIMIARLMIPATGPDEPVGESAEAGSGYNNSMEAIVRGTADGVMLLINIVAMLVVLVALVALVNELLGLLPNLAGAPVTLQRLFGWLMMPLAWLIGVPWHEAHAAGQLLGIKTVLNELLAYLELARLAPEALSERSRLLMTYALCGFANFGSLGIMIGGLVAMAPERRDDIVSLGMQSVVAGTLSTCMGAAVVGLVL
ncbi:MAG: nucleoside:proton symporter [Alphaproteobacteria bacterium]|nr:nucleoside:proton symporter [Alphaproteobacteria bacterium]